MGEWVFKRSLPFKTKMKKFLSLLILSAGLTSYAQTCCPQPPPGYDCYVDPPALLTSAPQIATQNTYLTTDMMVWETHVTQAIEIKHPVVTGVTYEVQFTDSLTAPVWKSQARWTAVKDDIQTTHVPVYPCVRQRFFRVCAQQL